MLGKQLHWSVVGALFKPLHEHLDELIDSWRDLADTVAERSVALGLFPDGQSGTVSASSEIPPVERGPLETEVVVREIVSRLAAVTERIRGRMDRLGELDLA